MEQGNLEIKLKIFAYIIIGLFFILVLKLAIVQLFFNDVYQTKAKNNRVRLLPIKATRGEIYSNDGTVVASNELVYTLSLSNISRDKQAEVIKVLVDLLGTNYPEITAEYIQEKFEAQRYRLYEPIVIIRDISWEMVVKLQERKQDIPGMNIDIEPLRTYPQGSLAGHVLGYIHSINAEELAVKVEEEKYNVNSLIGKSGIEKQYENILRGEDGALQAEVDVRGRPVGELVTMDPKPGGNLYLTIDTKLQAVMEKSLDDNLARIQRTHPKAKVGSAVLLDVKTGKVLAMASKPDMYPDDWKGNISGERAEYYFPQGNYDPLNPGGAMNRAIQVSYPPGSTFKPITGMAALEKGVMSPEDLVNCAGSYWLPPYIRCTKVHGNVNYYSAMATSCNTYFQEMGRRAGNEEIIRVGNELGLGQKTGIDLPFETKGLLPTEEWKKNTNAVLLGNRYKAQKDELEKKYADLLAAAHDEPAREKIQKDKDKALNKLDAQYNIDFNFDTKWQDFDTFNMSIGQGANSYSVMQLANFVATIANDGKLMKPYLLDRVVLADGTIVQKNEPEKLRYVDIETRTLAETRAAMLQVTKKGGAGYFLFANFPAEIEVAAKTGTAETGRVGDSSLKECHGVFVAFAPYDDPQIAFAGLVEYGQTGSESAGWVAKAVFEQYFGIKDHYADILAAQTKAQNVSGL